MSKSPYLVYSPELLSYNFGPQHPFNPLRIKLTIDLMQDIGLFKPGYVVPPSDAQLEDLLLVHDNHYVEAVKRAGGNGAADEQDTQYYELGTEDNPVFSKMHEATSLLVGSTLSGAKHILSGKADHALNLSGGLHHAQRAKASGFCIYNDLAVAIAFFRKQGMKVVYVDIDAHHGDGVQWMFYDDPNVLTVSLHESGRYLFPGTGTIYERGSRAGFGYAVNVPLEPFTEDCSFVEVFDKVVPKVIAQFKPDIIVSQHGCDSHEFDPLAHLSFTTESFAHAAKSLHSLAHKHCSGRWLAAGGGGYDFWRVVPRVWSALWAEMLEESVPERVPQHWLEKYKKFPKVSLPETMKDDPAAFPPKPRRDEISEKNILTVEKTMNPQFLMKGDPEEQAAAAYQ